MLGRHASVPLDLVIAQSNRLRQELHRLVDERVGRNSKAYCAASARIVGYASLTHATRLTPPNPCIPGAAQSRNAQTSKAAAP